MQINKTAVRQALSKLQEKGLPFQEKQSCYRMRCESLGAPCAHRAAALLTCARRAWVCREQRPSSPQNGDLDDRGSLIHVGSKYILLSCIFLI